MGELYQLPDGWEWKELKSFGKFIRGVSYKKDQLLESSSDDSFILLRANNIQNELNLDETQIVPKDLAKGKEIKDGDILFAMSSGSKHLVGKNILLNGLNNYTFGAFCSVYRNQKNDMLDNYYLSYVLKSNLYREKLSDLSMGANINNLKSSDLEIMKIPLPPLSEQQRIVAKLDTLFEKIDKAMALHQKNIDETNVFMASVLNDVFGELEEKYRIVKISDIAQIKGGKRLPKGQKLSEVETNYPYIRVADFLDNGTINIDSIQYITDEIYQQIKNYTISSNDLYISIAGTIGKTGIVPKELDGANLTENAAKLVYKTNDISNKYVYFLTNSSKFGEQIGLATKIVAQPKLALSRLSEVKLSLPPLQTQQKVVAYLDEISQKLEKVKTIQKEKMQSLKALKASILDQAFRGKL
mgnify:CR=1 FL=1